MKRSIRRTLSNTEREFISAALKEAHSLDPVNTQAELLRNCITAATSAESGVPSLVALIRQLRTLETSPGLIVLEELPKVADPRRLILFVGSILGTVIQEVNEGDYVIAIKERRTTPGERPSFQNAREFYLHTDLSYVPEPPLFLLMHSVVNNEGEGGLSIFADIELITQQLSALDMEELTKPQFLFQAPIHYKGGGVVRFPILTQACGGKIWRLRFRRDNLRAETRRGIEAVVQLLKAMDACAEEFMLRTDSLVLLDNQSFLHGRTAFAGTAQSAAEPRHLNRIYATL